MRSLLPGKPSVCGLFLKSAVLNVIAVLRKVLSVLTVILGSPRGHACRGASCASTVARPPGLAPKRTGLYLPDGRPGPLPCWRPVSGPGHAVTIPLANGKDSPWAPPLSLVWALAVEISPGGARGRPAGQTALAQTA